MLSGEMQVDTLPPFLLRLGSKIQRLALSQKFVLLSCIIKQSRHLSSLSSKRACSAHSRHESSEETHRSFASVFARKTCCFPTFVCTQ